MRPTILDNMIPNDIFLGEGGYNYYCFLRPDGQWTIMRETVATSTLRYCTGNSKEQDILKTFSQAVAARATLSYGYSGPDI